MTDAYFHYTPSQIMLAALSLADEELCDRVIHETFHLAHTPTPQHAPSQSRKAAAAAEEKVRLLGAEMRDQVRAAVASCRSLLAQEPPAHMTGYWGTPAQTDAVKPPLRKLRKCRDPDRFDLVALHKARREQAMRNGDADDEDGRVPAGSSLDDDDAAVFGKVGERDVKRRKVNKGLEDPFGEPL
jgi:cyclin H